MPARRYFGIQIELDSEAATQTKNLHSISFPLRGGGVGGGAAEKMQGNFLSLPARVRERGRGDCRAIGVEDLVSSYHDAARVKSVRVLLEMRPNFLIQ